MPRELRIKWLYWTPRILGIALTIFVTLFAFDVFEEGSVLEKFVGFLIHLLPTFLILLFLFISWKWDSVGGTMFVCLGVYYMVLVWESSPYSWLWSLILAGPVMAMGVLFMLSAVYNKSKFELDFLRRLKR
ncbi:MAG: hypothetical protein ABIE68_00920 [bacterium]